MIDRRQLLTSAAATVVTSLLPHRARAGSGISVSRQSAVTPDVAVPLRVLRYVDENHVELVAGGASKLVQRGDLFENWTVMEIVTGADAFVVLEDFQRRDGHIVFVDTDGVGYDFGKSLEPTFAGSAPLWLGHTREEVIASAPTRWGRVGFAIQSALRTGRIDARISLPARGIAAQTKLRLRARAGARLRSVTLNGRNWKQFDAAGEVIVVPPETGGVLTIVAQY